MFEGKLHRTWDQTAAINFYTANAFSKKPIPFYKFHPFMEYQSTGGIPCTIENRDQLIKMWTSPNVKRQGN